VATLEIKTADEFIDSGLEARWAARRAARQTDVFRRILRTFVDRGGPIRIEDIAAAFPDRRAEATRQTLVTLDDDDVIRIHEDHVDLAYPFSAIPTPFVVRVPDGQERYTCCAIDALGIAPLLGQPVEIRSQCHDCKIPLTFPVEPDGPGLEADGVMLWLGKRADDRCRAVDSL
jgi:hypothetical protein